RKRIHDAIRMAVYNATSALARLVGPHYARAQDEARTLLRSRAIAGLCQSMNATFNPLPGHKAPTRVQRKGHLR
ncbi:MAG: hypothetical protein ACRDY7_15385, partial [Acidimicrobiia bacterium]